MANGTKIKLERGAVQNSVEWGVGNINERRTHCCCFLHATPEQGMTAGALIFLANKGGWSAWPTG